MAASAERSSWRAACWVYQAKTRMRKRGRDDEDEDEDSRRR
jgi:hypothetical protein